MATRQSRMNVSELKKSRKYRDALRKTSRKLHLEQLEDRRLMALGPTLVAILPNGGTLLQNNDVRNVAPKELTFKFVQGEALDANTLSTGIRLVRSGGDGIFGAGDVVVTPGFIGIGDNSREVVMRFSETLPDDSYRVTIIGSGAGALTDIAGNAFNNGANAQLDFKLDLGAQVVAVVPQPVTRVGSALSQSRRQIVVYFNNDNLLDTPASAENPQFYRLYATKNTVSPADDQFFLPQTVAYDPAADTATLTFSNDIDQLVAPDGSADPARSFRLRIGTAEDLRTVTDRGREAGLIEVGSTFDSAVALTGATSGPQGFSYVFDGTISRQPFDLQWPGANTEPGHRAIPVEDHLQGAADPDDGITTIYYNFQSGIGTIPGGLAGSQPAFNLITETQKQRAREVFELYSRYSGIQFVESATRGIIVATGDMRAVRPTVVTGIGHPMGIADVYNRTSLLAGANLRAIMDNGETWNDSYGGTWMQEAMQQIGRVLGLGYSFDLPPLTINGQDPALGTAGVPLEPVFPGDNDIVHMRNLFRPEGKDIDLYKFTLDGSGALHIETIAERLTSSSSLDTYLRLYKVGTDGKPVIYAQNDDYFSKDSAIDLNLDAGDYYLGVSAKGNNQYDPNVADSGVGGTTQGAYQLRVDFRKSATNAIVDATGTQFDGDSDGNPGGVYNFWFRAAPPIAAATTSRPATDTARTLFVDKSAVAGGNGREAAPFNNIATALTAARPFDIVRIVGNNGFDGIASTLGNNLAYQIGFNTNGDTLSDGNTLAVPKNVTLMIDAGAIFQLRRASINTGSTSPAVASDQSGGAIQVLGTPIQSVYFTSYNEQGANSIGLDTNPQVTTPTGGDWGGISFKNDLDKADGRFIAEEEGVFLNYVNHADIRYGGGQVDVNSVVQVVNPIDMTDVRPTISYNRITNSADAAMAANPDSFEETNFLAPKYQDTILGRTVFPDYKRVGPDIHGNTLLSNTTNGLFVRTRTPAGNAVEELTVAGRFDDTDIVHVIQENLSVKGTPGGPTLETVAPPINLVVLSQTAGGNLPLGAVVEYRLVYVDTFGNEGLVSAATLPITINAANRAVRLTNLPVPTGQFVGRHLYRRVNGGANQYELVASIPASQVTYVDTKLPYDTASNNLIYLQARTSDDQTPAITLVSVAEITPAIATGFVAGNTVQYRISYLDQNRRETPLSNPTATLTFSAAGRGARLTNLPAPPTGFTTLRLYRQVNGTGGFVPVSETLVLTAPTTALPLGSVITTIDDVSSVVPYLPPVDSTAVNSSMQRQRTDGSLVVDPAVVLKFDGSRIEAGVGANVIAEGVDGLPIVFTSLSDDRYGAGGTFDTRNDGNARAPVAGNWGGIFFSADASGSIDFSVIAYAGGLNRVEGNFTGFNAVEIHQADARVANTEFEFNADGTGGTAPAARFGRGFNGRGNIFIRGSQPVVVNNTVHDNRGAFVNVNVNALNSETIVDLGRQRGLVNRVLGHFDNNGPLIADNKLINNEINGMIVRGGTVTTEAVMDDSDIVHVLFDRIQVVDFHTFGGLRLESQADESLVLKAAGTNAGITANGRPLEIDDRIGGRIQFLGQPGFPVVMTSFTDDTASAGFTPDGRPQGDTNGDNGTPPALPTGQEVNNGTLIDNDTLTTVIGHIQHTPIAAGNSTGAQNNGFTVQGRTLLLTNQNFLNNFTSYVDVGTTGAAIDLSASTITLAPTLVSDDLVASEGTFAGANGTVAWRVETRIDDGSTRITNTIKFTSTAPLGALRYVNYLDQNILAANDDLVYLVGSPGTPDFRVYTLDNAQRIGFAQGGIYTPGAGLANATYNGFAADTAADLQGAITGATGATYSPTGTIDLVDLPRRFDQALGTVFGLNNASTALSWTVNPAARTATITTFLELVTRSPAGSGSPGDWQGITIDRFAHDRNVADLQELEAANGTAPGANATAANPQLLGLLAPFEKGGDDNQRLGFTVHGLLNAANDIDTYSFEAFPGTEVWFDIDRTTHALDAVLELVDNLGNVLARSDNSPAESTGAEALFGTARRLQKTPPYEGVDSYTTNPRDPGFRAVLEGPAGIKSTYFIRVRSSSDNLANINGGKSLGAYQLQLRLREEDEIGGTTVQFADIRNAVNGIAIFGQPTHSPLAGEHTETQGANNAIGQAQQVGNLLGTDRGTLGVAGLLSSSADVDWYTFTVNYNGIQSDFENPERPSPENWFATIFDIDYADGYARPDTIINVYDNAGNLVLSSRDSNIADDRPRPLLGADVSDLNRGSSGAADPFIGSTELPQGTYFVSVASDAVMPREFQQYFQAGATNPLFRLEPINSVVRAVEDHIFVLGDPPIPASTAADPVVGNGSFLSPGSAAIPFHLGDVGLFIGREALEIPVPEISQIVTVDPFTGASEVNVGTFGFDIGDIAFRNDFQNLFSFSLDTGDDGVTTDDDSGHYLQINPATAATTDLGDDGIQTFEFDNATPPATRRAHPFNGSEVGWGIQFDALTFRENPANGTVQRLVAVGHRGDAAFNLQNGVRSRENIVYQMDVNTGAALVTGAADPYTAAMTDVFEVGEIFTAGRLGVPAATRQDTTVTPPVTIRDITDGLTFTVDDGINVTTFEFDGGPDLVQDIRPTQNRAVRDGNFFIMDPDNTLNDGISTNDGNETLLQFDTGSSIFVLGSGGAFPDADSDPANDPDPSPGSITINPSVGTGITFEFDRDGNLANGNSILVDVSGPLGPTAVANLLVAAINAQTNANTFNVSAQYVGDRIVLTNDTDIQVSPEIANLNLLKIRGATGKAPVLQSVEGARITDGDQFHIRVNVNGDGTVFDGRFEFNDITVDPAFTGGYNPISFNAGMTSQAVAVQIKLAIDGLAGQPIQTDLATGSDRIVINGEQINNLGNGYFRDTSVIDDLTATLIFREILAEDFDLAADTGPIATPILGIGSKATNAVNNSTRFTASTAFDRINFPPIDTATKDPVNVLDVSGVPVWTFLPGSASGLTDPQNTQIIFAADDQAGEVAIAIQNAINAKLSVSGVMAAAVGGPNTPAPAPVNITGASVTAPPPFTFSGGGPGGRITGLVIDAFNDVVNTATTAYAISDNGGLYRVSMNLDLNSNLPADAVPAKYSQITTTFITTSAADLSGINFQGLTWGPPTVENGRYAQMLFGLTGDGRVYAFNTAGVLQPIFANGATSIATGVTNARGLAFSNLDSNRWTTSFARGGDAGHGINAPFDQSRNAQTGNRSFNFTNYNVPGGAYGSIVSNEFSLQGYSVADQPVLYFNYRADTEGDGALLGTPTMPMLDSLRVFVSGDDGDWHQLTTNNSLRGDGIDEYTTTPNGGVEETFDNVNSFRQVRVNLAPYAGQEHLRLRFDYSTAGGMDLGNAGTTGDELRAVRGEQIMDGDVFEIDGSIDALGNKVNGNFFEFDLGFSLQVVSGPAINDGETFSIDNNISDATPAVVFEFDKNNSLGNALNTRIRIDDTMSSQQIVAAITTAINGVAGLAAVDPLNIGDELIQLVGADDVQISAASAIRRVAHGHTLVFRNGIGQGVVPDGESFLVTDGRDVPTRFEFDFGGGVTLGSIPIPLNSLWDENRIAQETFAVVNRELPDAVARYTKGARVNLLSAVSVSQTPAPGSPLRVQLLFNASRRGVLTTVPAGFTPSTAVEITRDMSRTDVANQINDQLEQFYYNQKILAVPAISGVGAANRLDDGETFTLSDGVNPAVTFEFNTGVVLSLPSGGGNDLAPQHVNNQDTIRLRNTTNGTTVTFEFDNDVIPSVSPGNIRIPFDVNTTQVQLATLIRNAILALPAATRTNLSINNAIFNGSLISGTRVQIGGTDPNFTVTLGNVTTGTIGVGFSQAGTAGSATPTNVLVNFQPSTTFTAAMVADQIETAIDGSAIFTVSGVNASTGAFGGPDQRRVTLTGRDLTLNAGTTGLTLEVPTVGGAINNNVWKQYQDLIRVIAHNVYDAGPTGVDVALEGDDFQGFNSNLRFQNNANEGIYIDDIIIGFAERGELATGSTAQNDFVANPLADPLGIPNGSYQLEVRRGPEVGVPGNDPPLALFRSFDTNDILTQGHQIEAPIGANVRDGQTFVLSDGVNRLTYEFNDLSTTNDVVTGGNVQINFRSTWTADEVARAIRDAINNPDSQSVLKLQASIGDGTLAGGFTTSNKVNIAGPGTFNVEGAPTPEVNDLLSQATPVDFDGNLYVASGSIGDNPLLNIDRALQGRDIDLFRITLVAGQTVRLDTDAVTLGSNVDTVMRVFNSAGAVVLDPITGQPIISDDLLAPGETRIPIRKFPTSAPINTLDSYLNFTAPADGDYYIGISGFGNSTYNPVTGAGLVSAARLGKYQLNISGYGASSLDDQSNMNTFNEEFGDKNLARDQGQIIVQGNRISNSSNFGILIDSGIRTAADGSTPHNGPVRALREPNTTRQVPGVVVTNNTLFANQVGAIQFSGDPNPDAPVPFGRIINNTLFGGGGSLQANGLTDVGIRVTDNAAPTLLNNIVANFTQGLFVDASSTSTIEGGTSASGTVVGAMLYQGNITNAPAGLGSSLSASEIVLNNSEPLFVDFIKTNFYLQEFSDAIDTAIDSLEDRPALVTVRDPLGIPVSNILAPDRDGLGQKRVDDTNFESPDGVGETVAKDRGALDRVDFTGPTSRLINPQDNDALGIDSDPSVSIVVLQNQILTNFSIQLIDAFDPFSPLEGSGIDDTSIAGRSVVISATTGLATRTLVEGVDYSFSYDATNNLIRLNPLGGVWPLSTTYRITLDNDPLGDLNTTDGIRDLAGNRLLTNHPADGLHYYTIFLGSAIDYGDAPLASQSTFAADYPTLFANNGASHQIRAGYHLGALETSAEPDGQPTAAASGDAADDGVIFNSLQPGNSGVTVNFASTDPGRIDAWLDLNRDGDWNDANEHILNAQPLTFGPNLINFSLPSNVARGATFARFRLTSAGIATPFGPATDGEVEDYSVAITGPAFQNPNLGGLDVNNDGEISPIDALLIINFLNVHAADFVGNIPLPNVFAVAPPPFYDTDGNGFLTANDSKKVIDYLNDHPVGNGEGEGEGEAPVALARSASGMDVAALAPVFSDATSAGQDQIPAVIYANSSVIVEVKDEASRRTELDDQLFSQDSQVDALADNFEPVIDQLHGTPAAKSKNADKYGPLDHLDGLIGDIAADVHSGRKVKAKK